MAPRSPDVGPLNDIPVTNGSSIGDAAVLLATAISDAAARTASTRASRRPRRSLKDMR